MIKLLYVTDLHGWQAGYRRVEQVAKREGVSAVVNGGDMLPKDHPVMAGQREFLERFLPSHLDALAAAGVRFYGQFGNDDVHAHYGLWRGVVAAHGNAADLAERWAELGDGLIVRGVPYVPDPPFALKDWAVLDYPGFRRPRPLGPPCVSTPDGFRAIADVEAFFRERPTLAGILDRLAGEAPSMERAVVVAHCPPQATLLGCVYPGGTDVGSKAVLDFIETRQPLLTLHGHIHESPDVTGHHTARLGRTTAHQPGQRGPGGGVVVLSVITIERARHVRIDRRLEAV